MSQPELQESSTSGADEIVTSNQLLPDTYGKASTSQSDTQQHGSSGISENSLSHPSSSSEVGTTGNTVGTIATAPAPPQPLPPPVSTTGITTRTWPQQLSSPENPTSSEEQPPLSIVSSPTSNSPIFSSHPSLPITLLLISGARHQFTVDSNFLTRHSVIAPDNDPLNLGVYTLKECIWKDWKEG